MSINMILVIWKSVDNWSRCCYIVAMSKKQERVYGYFLLFHDKPINPKPITYKSAVDNLCRLGTKYEPRKKIKNGKKVIFWQDHKGLKIVPNHDPLKV